MTDLPTGTVTFLFTDIEGSTKLAQQSPAAWEAFRAHHHAILRAACEAHQGYVFQIIGDAFCVAFASAPDALTAAVEAQRALQDEAWNEMPIKVRMGLHTGTAEAQDGEYRGYLTLAQVQRVMSVAYGGQTLVSNATAGLLTGQLPNDVSLRDMGEHRLKGLTELERILQVVAPELPSDFPPLKSLSTVPNNLPVQLTSFVGREKEIAEVQRLLTTTRLLTLTGSGGTGKTRLSLEVAAGLFDRFPDGIWFVELAPLTDPTFVPSTMASVLSVPEQPGRPLLATLTEYLRDKHLLLILDNCEHLIEASARLADALLHAAPGIRILATGRELLGIAGETAYRVPSLPCPDITVQLPAATLMHFDAVQLFVARASAVHPHFDINTANAAAVAQICIRLDGIPLAIELAAARIGVFAPEQIAARLDDRFRLLTGGSRTALPRQQTLRNTIDWSFSLLSNLERILLRRLAIFTGGWTFEAAEAIAADDGLSTPEVERLAGADNPAHAPVLLQSDLLDPLSHLVEKSLVLTDDQAGETRYRMLETIRRYAMDKLIDAFEVEIMRMRHAVYYRQLATTLINSTHWRGQGFQLANRALREHDNWRATLDWCFGGGHTSLGVELAALLANFWYSFGLLKEGRAWLEKALSQEISQSALRASVLRGLGMIESRQGDFHLAATHIEKAAAIWRELGDMPGLADALHYVGHATFDERNYGLARKYFEESRALYERLGDSSNTVTLFADVGLVAYHLGDYADAERRFTQALAEYRRLGRADGVGLMLLRLGDLSRIAGDDQGAHEQYEESLRLHRELRANLELASSLHKLAQLACKRGERDLARAYLLESMGLQRESGNKQGIAECLAAFAALASQESDLRRSARLFAAAEALLAEIGAPLAPADQIDFELDVRRLRMQFPGAAFSDEWAAGQSLPIDQAIALALEAAAS